MPKRTFIKRRGNMFTPKGRGMTGGKHLSDFSVKWRKGSAKGKVRRSK